MVCLENRFILDSNTKEEVLKKPFFFIPGSIEEIYFIGTYSRLKINGERETWNEFIIRRTEEIFSDKKLFFSENGMEFNEVDKQIEAREFILSIFNSEEKVPPFAFHQIMKV